MTKVFPISTHSFRTFGLTQRVNDIDAYKDEVIEITREQLEGLRNRTYRFSDDLKSVVPMDEFQIKQLQDSRKKRHTEKSEAHYKAQRFKLLDAYRKYQAAVNYGEIQRDVSVDEFVSALKAKDWSVLDNVPKQLLYFMGRTSLNMNQDLDVLFKRCID